MKFWRNTSVAALAVAFSASTAFAALAPKAPAAATGAVSGPTGAGVCAQNTNLTEKDGLVMCVEYQDHTSASWGNGFPWENSTFFFSTFRNQYLYPSSTVNDVKAVSQTMKSIGARAVSFSGQSTNVYSSGFMKVTDSPTDTLSTTFAVNTGGITYCNQAAPFTITHRPMPSGKAGGISNCLTCPGSGPNGDEWCKVGPTAAAFAAVSNIMMDHNLTVGVGNTGAAVWDMTNTSFGDGCAGPTRAYGSGSFANSQHLTTALGVDTSGFIWVFRGTAKPPAATVEQQIKEIVRLLLTPEGLRCSGLDLVGGNGIIEDTAIAFPNGSSIDPIQPQVTTGGIVTGDELVDGLRSCGWNCN